VNNRSGQLHRTFAAIGDATRLAIIAQLEAHGPTSISALAEPFPITLPAVMKHLGVLSDAGLITREKTGRVVMVSLDPAPLRKARDWIGRYERFWSPRLDRLVALVEAEEAKKR
jgi:DNA-binding transcriptional ArsR family regulator